MQYLLLVGFGGALGAMARYMVNHVALAQLGSSLLGTFIVNVSGSFVLGLVIGLASGHTSWSLETRLFLTVGFLGSYTTFSTFSVAIVQSLEAGDISRAVINLSANLLVGLLAAFLGLMVAKLI